MTDFERDKFKIEIKHWTGTIVVAVVAVFVILGLLKGQQILGNFLNRKAAPNLEKGERSQISDQITGLGLNIIPSVSPLPSPLVSSPRSAGYSFSPSPTLILTPTPARTLTSVPTPSPTHTSALLPTTTPTPLPTPVYTPTSTPVYSPPPTPSPIPNPTLTLSPTPNQTSCGQPALKNNESLRQVVINEIAWMGTEASTADEWIELKNNTGQEIDLNCWILVSEDGTPNIKLSSKINANWFYLLERTDDNTIKDITVDSVFTGALGNSGEILRLYDGEGNLQDEVGHRDLAGQILIWYSGDNTTKSSMERKNSNTSGIDQNNWQTNDGITKNGQDSAGNLIKGTPKSPNS